MLIDGLGPPELFCDPVLSVMLEPLLPWFCTDWASWVPEPDAVVSPLEQSTTVGSHVKSLPLPPPRSLPEPPPVTGGGDGLGEGDGLGDGEGLGFGDGEGLGLGLGLGLGDGEGEGLGLGDGGGGGGAGGVYCWNVHFCAFVPLQV